MASRDVIELIGQAREGNVQAQFHLGKRYLDGSASRRRDYASAFYWLRKAAATGHLEAQKLIASAIPESAIDTPHAVSGYYESGCAAGSSNASVVFADWLLTGHVAGGGEMRALETLRPAAEAGDRKAQLRLGLLLSSIGFGEAEHAQAVRWLESAAEQGSRAAGIALSDFYWERSDPLAARWIDEMADSLDGKYAYRTALVMLGQGKIDQAAKLLARAAAEDFAPAQLSFGLLHILPWGKRRSGVPHSLKRAAYWLERASRSGSAQASFELYRLFRRRGFSLVHRATSDRYLELAARQGCVHAKFLAGIAGLRLNRPGNSDVAAADWVVQAASQGHAQAARVVALLYPRPPSPQETVAAERARVIRLIARSRVAMALRLELAHVFGMSVAELLAFDPTLSEHETCVAIDSRRHSPRRRRRRRIVAIETGAERALLARARRFLDPANPHPSDVRGPYGARKLDLQAALTLVGANLHLFEPPGSIVFPERTTAP
jgi:TPR repeat protein